MTTVDVYIHKTSPVPSSRLWEANSAIKEYLENAVEHSFQITYGKKNLSNDKAPTDDDGELSDFINDMESSVESYLNENTAHLVIFQRSIGFDWDDVEITNGTAGQAAWEAGVPTYEDGLGNVAGSREWWRGYGMSIVNSATGDWPYSKKVFRSTVIHELGHQLGAGHANGEIYKTDGGIITGDKYEATPMPTWYVEQQCSQFPTGNAPLSADLCKLDQPNTIRDSQKACFHRNLIAAGNCTNSDRKSTQEAINDHIDNNL